MTLGCQDVYPYVPAEQHIEWEIDDPKGRPLEFFRATRDKIKAQVKIFLEEND